ncbi:MAG: cupin domain-containing protein [Hyphomicrobium sp.]|nr:cupin domain-containing protein [Hyphomicrobium sp.]
MTVIARTSLFPFSVAALLSCVFLGATIVHAGECPAGSVTENGQSAGATAHKKVSEKLLGQIDLSKEKIAADGHHFRMRRLDIQPGGELAWHSHTDRPALIYVVSGTITEYSSHCAVPIVHRTGELSVEQGGLSHWWKNTSKHPVVLLSADITADPEQPGM